MVEEELINDALELFRSGIAAVHPATLFGREVLLKASKLIISDINNNLTQINLKEFERIIVIGAGKASAAMAKGLEKLFLSSKLKITGIVITKYGCTTDLKSIKILEAGHPLPDENGIKATKELLALASSATEKDLVINLLSGGASSLLPAPIKGITLQDKIKTTSLLLNCGAAIEEINAVRKHISKIKGGGLLKYIYPAQVISLIISDVTGDRLDIIGSGITFPDNSTGTDALNVIEKYDLMGKLPQSVASYFNKVRHKKNKTMPISNYTNLILANNRTALEGIKKTAIKLGYASHIVDDNLSGEAMEVGEQIIKDLLVIKKTKKGKHCFLYGGETTVTIRGKGKGGRNQELALSAALKLQGKEGVVLLSGGTDGNDGPTDAAGAFCSGKTITLGKQNGLEAEKFLRNNDSYNYFEQINHLIKIGFSGTNVADVIIVLINGDQVK